MDAVLTFAILSFSLFVGVLISGLFYVWVVRPQLMDRVTPMPQDLEEPILRSTSPSFEQLKSQTASIDDRIATLQQEQQAIGTQIHQLHDQLVQGMGGLPAEFAALHQDINAPDNQLSELIGRVERLHQAQNQLQQQFAALQASINTDLTTIRDHTQNSSQYDQHNSTLLGQLGNKVDTLSGRILHQEGWTRQLLKENVQEIVSRLTSLSSNVQGIANRQDIPTQLTGIKGIGKKYSSLLNKAGVTDFEQLAAMTPDELRALYDTGAWQRIKAEDWIAQAQAIVEQRKQLEGNS